MSKIVHKKMVIGLGWGDLRRLEEEGSILPKVAIIALKAQKMREVKKINIEEIIITNGHGNGGGKKRINEKGVVFEIKEKGNIQTVVIATEFPGKVKKEIVAFL